MLIQACKTSGTDRKVYVQGVGDSEKMPRPLPKGYLGYRYFSTDDNHVVDTNRFSVNSPQERRGLIDQIDFRSIKANDITDNLVVKIVSVNGIDAETTEATGYIRMVKKKQSSDLNFIASRNSLPHEVFVNKAWP